MTSLEKLIAESKARMDRATPGPWRLSGCNVFLPEPYENEWIGLRGPVDDSGNDIRTRGGFTRALLTVDARFIAYARTEVPLWCGMVENMKQDMSRIKTLCEAVIPNSGHMYLSIINSIYKTICTTENELNRLAAEMLEKK